VLLQKLLRNWVVEWAVSRAAPELLPVLLNQSLAVVHDYSSATTTAGLRVRGFTLFSGTSSGSDSSVQQEQG
jgi:hypothetical protein